MNPKSLLILALIIIMVVGFAYVQSPSEDKSEEYHTYSQTRMLMDTDVTITVVDNNETHAYNSIEDAFMNMEKASNRLDSYNNSSEIHILNEHKETENASDDLIHVIERGIYYSQISDGAFDITVKPVLDLWESKFGPDQPNVPPTEKEINNTLSLVNSSNITIEDNTIIIEKNMGITLEGIAKGYAVDRAIMSLQENGIENGFVNAGGDGRYMGEKSDGQEWSIGLQDPDKKAEPITKISAHNISVATSGNYERYYNKSASASHIADPRTGYPVSHLISATIIAPTAMEADALATTVFVMEEEKGLEMIEKLEGVECLLINSEKEITRSSGFAKYE
ncbi:MAG: FAD:protein FMN transferase [Methanohalophilus sp.]